MTNTTNKPNASWFKQMLADRAISQRRLAAELNVDPAAVSHMFAGKRKVQLQEAEKMATLLKAPLDQVLSNLGVDPVAGAQATALLVGWIDAQGEVHESTNGHRSRVQAPTGLPERSYALRYQTAGTASAVRDGWILFYEQKDRIDASLLGLLCVCETVEGLRFVRAPSRGYKPGTFNLVGSMPGFQTLENISLKSTSPVLWMKTFI